MRDYLVVEGLQDERYREAAAAYGAALERLAHAYEADAEHRRDLLRPIWRWYMRYPFFAS